MSYVSFFDSNHTAGISVTAEVEIDWFNLGEFLAKQSSEAQAEFLTGMCAEFDRLGLLNRSYQFAYIVKELRDSEDVGVVRKMLFDLVCELDAED